MGETDEQCGLCDDWRYECVEVEKNEFSIIVIIVLNCWDFPAGSVWWLVGGQVSEKEDRKVLNKPNEIIFFLLLWRSLAAVAKDIYLWSWRVCGVLDWTVCDRYLNEYFAAAAALDKQ